MLAELAAPPAGFTYLDTPPLPTSALRELGPLPPCDIYSSDWPVTFLQQVFSASYVTDPFSLSEYLCLCWIQESWSSY